MSPRKKKAAKKAAPKKRPVKKTAKKTAKKAAPKKRARRIPPRDARGRFISREARAVQRRRFTREQEDILDDMRVRLRGAKPRQAGQEYELTVRYQAGRDKGSAVTAKIRVEVLRQMPAETARLLLDRGVRDGVMPPGIRVAYVDWAKPGRSRNYVYEGGMVPEALRKLYAIVHAPDSHRRFERVRRDAEGQG